MLIAFAAMAVAADAPIAGKWTNPSGSVVVAIEPCGGAWCGTVARASDGAKADALRGGTAALVGTRLMTGFKPAGANKWRGRLFIPDINRRSHAELRIIGADQLKVIGCMVGRMICKSQMWTRAD